VKITRVNIYVYVGEVKSQSRYNVTSFPVKGFVENLAFSFSSSIAVFVRESEEHGKFIFVFNECIKFKYIF